MALSPETAQNIYAYYSEHGQSATCEKFNLRPDTLKRYLRWHRENSGESIPTAPIPENETIIDRMVKDDQEIISVKSRIVRTVDELLDYCSIDRSIWEAYKSVVNQWGSEKNPCFQVKAWLRLKEKGLDIKKQLEIFKADAAAHAPKYPTIKHDLKSDNLLEISCPDIHFGQLSWDEETGRENYDIKIAEQKYIEAVSDLAEKSKPYSPSRILLPIGSDFFNVNSLTNTTLAGTKQDEDTRWQKTFQAGWKMVVRAADILRTMAPVDIIVIPGNHDWERSFYLGSCLAAWYNNCNDVRVFNSPRPRKYAVWGRCMIGYTHGDKEKAQTLPLIMATERPNDWAVTEYREWHIGHLHHKKTLAWLPVQEENGVRVRIMPSICARDAWHSESGYDAIREAVGLIWNKQRGNVAQFSYTIERGREN